MNGAFQMHMAVICGVSCKVCIMSLTHHMTASGYVMGMVAGGAMRMGIGSSTNRHSGDDAVGVCWADLQHSRDACHNCINSRVFGPGIGWSDPGLWSGIRCDPGLVSEVR